MLDVVISYQACSQHTTERKAEPCAHIGLSLGILRIAGLKVYAHVHMYDVYIQLDLTLPCSVQQPWQPGTIHCHLTLQLK